MTNITYHRKRDGVTCTTPCKHFSDRLVGSLACEACHYHFMKLPKMRQVICKYEDEKKN